MRSAFVISVFSVKGCVCTSPLNFEAINSAIFSFAHHGLNRESVFSLFFPKVGVKRTNKEKISKRPQIMANAKTILALSGTLRKSWWITPSPGPHWLMLQKQIP